MKSKSQFGKYFPLFFFCFPLNLGTDAIVFAPMLFVLLAAFSIIANPRMPWLEIYRRTICVRRGRQYIAQGEFDAMAVFQATGVPAVSLPNGASSLPLEVLPLLEKFDKLYLWMDHDGPGQAGVDKFVQKLVRNRACM